MPAARSRAARALPIGLAHGVALVRPVARGAVITRDDVGPLPDSAAARAREALDAGA
jgi:predicted homoserine dehydrogenase-like protein